MEKDIAMTEYEKMCKGLFLHVQQLFRLGLASCSQYNKSIGFAFLYSNFIAHWPNIKLHLKKH